MKRTDEFSKALDSLDNDEMDKLLTLAKGLIRAQKAVRINSIKVKLSNKRKSKKVKDKV